ncbi:DDB1- and CUL4-associated factor 4-like [Argiope bruennichi]|uniref:DDB1- and CUL4-associated factor 4-like n=1 Tax=Argiope bruennichi TaxID=94029 RepID=UPI0024948EA9|nr:DDB1- and CUL4-associated factor 4-like [Argiope bruennichi]
MKRTHGDYEIPGFYVEPQTGRYFQVPINGSPLPSLFNGARVEPASADFNIRRRKIIYEPKRPRFNSIVNCINSNQMGSIDTLTYQQEVSALRMENWHLGSQYVYPFGNSDIEIRLLKGGMKYLYGHWSSSSNATFFYAFDDFRSLEAPACVSHHYQIAYISPQIVVADMCEAYSHRLSILYVGNDFNSGLGTARLTWRRELSENVTEGSRHFYVNSAVWCCCSNRFTGLFALGIENGIYIHNYDTHLYTKPFKGQVLGIHYKKTGDIIYAGVNHGKLITVDTRVRNPVCKTKLNDYALTELSLLEDENYMICGGLGNFLAQVDLRMQRKTVTYLGELRNTLKNPISFNETHNILCSTGSDSVTRLWSLRGGRPLKTFPPPFPGHESRAWLTGGASSKLGLYVVSKHMTYLHEC